MTQPAPSTTAPIALFNRACVITVGSVQIQRIGQQKGLDVWFQARRSLKPQEPNTCDVRIYNLSDATRKQIESSANGLIAPGGAVLPPLTASAKELASATVVVPVKIMAGYVGGMSQIFLGELRSAQTTTDGATTVTELTTGDGDQATILARSTASFGKGATAYVVAQQLLKDMGCGVGNLASVAEILKSSSLYTGGVVLKGPSLDILIDLARSCGLEVSVQAGVAQWTSLGQPLSNQAYSLSSSTGLIGSPSVDTKGVLSLEMLMAPGIAPGKPIVMNAKYVQGLYRITSVETEGDLNGNTWSHKVEAKKYGLAP